MTEFGKQYLPHWLRGRILVTALALLVVLAIAVSAPAPIAWWLVFILLVNLVSSLVLRAFIARFGPPLLYAAFLIDILGVAVTVQYTNGIGGGFAAAYIIIALNCILLLGRVAFARVAGMILAAFFVQVGLELTGSGVNVVALSFVTQLTGQILLLGILFYTTYLVSQTSSNVLARWRGETLIAETGRANAEYKQARWALINKVALRVHEATLPQQVYESVGQELERVNLHCAVLEWAEQDVSFKVAYLSPTERVIAILETFNVNLSTFRVYVRDVPELARTVTTHEPAIVADLFASAGRVISSIPAENLAGLMKELEAGTLVNAPMLNHDEVSGVLAIWGKDLEQNDLAPLGALAQQAASALDKARLLTEQRKRAKQLEVVSAIAAQLGATASADEIIQPLVGAIGQRFGYPVVSILLVDPLHQELYVSATYSTISKLNYGPKRQSIDRGILGLVARSGEMYLARFAQSDPVYYSPHPERDPIRSELVLPLRDQERVMGVLDLESSEPDAFDASDVTALTLLAEQVAAALTKSRILALEQKRAAYLQLVGEIAARAASFFDPDAIVRTMVELVQERFGYHHVCVSLYDPVRNEMEQRASAGLNPQLYTVGYRWSAEKGLLGLAARTREPVYSEDLRNDSRYMPDPDDGAHSALCIPLVSGKTVLGVLDIESQNLNGFDANDKDAMQTLANQMAAALEKARSLQAERRRAAQLALVNRIASRTARLIPTEQLLREAVELIQSQFGYFNVAVFVRDENQPGVRLVANAGGLTHLATNGTTRLTKGIIAFVAESGNAYLCIDTHNDPYYESPFPEPNEDIVESEVAIPLRRGENVIGVLDVQSQEADTFTPSDITAIEALADQLAAGLENARLFESEARRVTQLDTIRVLALKVTAERDLDALLQSIVSSAADLVQAQGSALYIADEARGDLVVLISFGLDRNYVGNRLPLGEGMAGRVAQQGEPMIIDDYETWDKRAVIYEGHSLARMLSVPLKWQDRVLGVINLHRDLNHPPFNEEELRLANLFAAHAAIALENARLVGALQTRLRAQQTLSDLSVTLLDTTNVPAILEQAASAATRALESEVAALFFPDEEGKLVMQAHAGPLPEALIGSVLEADTNTITGGAFVARHHMLWSDSDPLSATQIPPRAKHSGYRAGLAMPMAVGERVVGVITLNTWRARQYTATDVQTLSLLANQTATALERARYFQQVQRRVNELDLLFEGFRATASTLEPSQVITRLLEQLVHAFDVTSAYFVQAHPSRGAWEQTHEYMAAAAGPYERTSTVRVWNTELLGELAQALAEGVHIAQYADPTLSSRLHDYMGANEVHTILRVPLFAASELIGYVSLWETRAPRMWTSDEMRFAQTMASQAAAALVNAQLYQAAQTRTRELHALYEASRLLNASLDMQTICETSVDSLRDILGYHHVSIYFVENNVLQMQVQRGYDLPLRVLQLDQGIIARAVRTQHVIFLPNVDQEPGYLAALSNVQSEIALPLLAGDRVLGVLNVETLRGETLNATRQVLTEADVQLLQTFANQLIIAMENARLFQETQQRLVQVDTLHAAAQAVNADLKLDAVLEQVADQFLAALGVDSCTISEFDVTQQQVITLLDRDPLSEVYTPPGSQFRITATEIDLTLHNSGRAYAFRRDDPNLNADIVNLLVRYKWRALVIAPLIAKGEIIGYVELGERKRERSFDAGELQLAESLANQAAIAIQNARLYRDAEQRLQETETLYRFARELGATLDIQVLGKRALEAAARLSDFDVGEVSLLRASDGALVPLVLTGTFDLVPEGFSLPGGTGIVGWVMEHGHAVRVGDVTLDPRYFPVSSHIMSEICLPLRIGTRVIGVLNLEAKAPNAFDAHVEQLLTAFANQLAVAIENARLYEQTKRDAEVKAALLRELSHRVKNNLAAITSLLYMALDEPPENREQILNETLGRVQSMALAHALLARSGQASVNLVELGRQVLQDTVRNLAQPGVVVDTTVEGQDIQVTARQTTTLALVLNELATNALRHGLNGAGISHLNLRFSVAREGQFVSSLLQDDGKGFSHPFDMSEDAGLGLNLVQTLVEKDLHGQFVLERRGAWTCADIRFRLDEDVL